MCQRGELIKIAIQMALDHCQQPRSPQAKPQFKEKPTSTLISVHMIRNGWCPFRMQYILARINYNVAVYLACLPPDEAHKSQHRHCLSRRRCVGDSIDDSIPVKPQHCGNCNGSCLEVGPPMHEVSGIIKEGKVPLFACSRQKNDRWSVGVLPASPNTLYISISHVWVDGLGMYIIFGVPFTLDQK